VLTDQDILSNLHALDARFNSAATSQDANFSAKLAVLECCGWIEEAMDDLVQRLSTRCLREQGNQSLCTDMIKRTYGFEYHQHFRKMVGAVIGLSGLEKLESKLDSGKFARLESALSTLKIVRDTHAHTYLKGTIPTLTAPSVIISQFTQVVVGLREFERRMGERTW
jgi:hypothetical protein